MFNIAFSPSDHSPSGAAPTEINQACLLDSALCHKPCLLGLSDSTLTSMSRCMQQPRLSVQLYITSMLISRGHCGFSRREPSPFDPSLLSICVFLASAFPCCPSWVQIPGSHARMAHKSSDAHYHNHHVHLLFTALETKGRNRDS